ncbi:MAG: epoxyqueuosine reductase [Candidatus Abyssubacteria bacterium]
MYSLEQIIIDRLVGEGACAYGFATTETLAGGPPSVDLEYVLPGAQSAVSFAVPLDQRCIPSYLMKRDHLSQQKDNTRANKIASGIALDLARFLEQKGYPSYPIASNQVYRQDTPRGIFDMKPDISLRYLAARSGVAHMSLSGNAITKNEGAAIILGGVVTTAELAPTDPLPKEENYCDGCRICMAACLSGLMDPEEEEKVTIGGVEFTYAKRREYNRCGYVCGGFTGLHPSGTWSTWSPGRFPIPQKDEDFGPAIMQHLDIHTRRPPMEGARIHPLIEGRFSMTCGMCQLVCAPDKKERKRRYTMLTESGCAVQNPDGSVEALPPQEAAERLAAMDPETRALYEIV